MTDIVERLRMERRATAWRRGLDCDFPTAFEQHPLCQEAAAEITRLRAEAEALRKDAARLDWLQTAADARKIELAKSLFGGGYEIGQWPSMRVTVKIGTLRDAIDAAIDATKGTT